MSPRGTYETLPIIASRAIAPRKASSSRFVVSRAVSQLYVQTVHFPQQPPVDANHRAFAQASAYRQFQALPCQSTDFDVMLRALH